MVAPEDKVEVMELSTDAPRATDLLPPLDMAKLNGGPWVVAEADADGAELRPAASYAETV